MKPLRLPGFTAEASLFPTARRQSTSSFGRSIAGGSSVVQQFGTRSMSGVDLGGYLRCRANGGDDLVCRFFGGLPPFTIGGLLF